MGVLVVMAMAVAGGLVVLCERAGNEGLDAGIAAALGARIDRDAGLGKRVDSAAADTAANERVNATVGQAGPPRRRGRCHRCLRPAR